MESYALLNRLCNSLHVSLPNIMIFYGERVNGGGQPQGYAENTAVLTIQEEIKRQQSVNQFLKMMFF